MTKSNGESKLESMSEDKNINQKKIEVAYQQAEVTAESGSNGLKLHRVFSTLFEKLIQKDWRESG